MRSNLWRMRHRERRSDPYTAIAIAIAAMISAAAMISTAAMILTAAMISTATISSPVSAQELETSATGSGALHVVGADGKPGGVFPLQHTEIRAEVSGSIARVVVEQEFRNPYPRSIEAVYTFPLPHTAAVDDLEMVIGARIVRGEIRTRQAAREAYDQARREGRMAALLDQERPNIFTQQIAHIQPGHSIRVRIRYVDMLEARDGGYEMVIPTVVGPRFIPGRPLLPGTIVPVSVSPGSDDESTSPPPQGAKGTGWSPDTDRVPDASRITPLVAPPGERAGHDIQITVDLDAGMSLQDIECPSHAVDIERPRPQQARLQLRPSDRIPNKDFILRYRVAGAKPTFGLLAHRDAKADDADGTFMLAFQPELEVTAREARPKELVFILDTSGSMRGEPIARSKAAMRWALQHLNPDDTFQIIRFSDITSSFSPLPVRCTRANVERALAYVEQMHGQGGTHMLSGIEAALDLPPDAERLRIVCMLTDGFIGNETEILAAIRQKIGEARLFSFGIGTSVNRYLLDEMADEGRGVVDYVSLDGEVRPIVERFYERIAKPYLTDLSVDWGALDVHGLYPSRLPDLFGTQPLVVAGRYRTPGKGEIVIRGKLGRRPFERRLQIELPAAAPAHASLTTLWARRRIDALSKRMLRSEEPALVAAVTEVALAHRLMSRYTSFVAVDNQVISKDGEPVLVPQPVEMPVGVSHEGVFGDQAGAHAGRRAHAIGIRGDVKSSDVSHVSTDKSLLSLPAEQVSNAVNLPPGMVTGGGELHVRGGRSEAVRVRVGAAALPVPVPSAVPGTPTAGADAEKPALQPITAQGFELRIEPETNSVLSGDPIRVTITLRNTGTAAAAVPRDLAESDLALRAWRDGQAIEVAAGRNVRRLQTVLLPPGAARTYRVVLGTSTVQFMAAGSYRIEVIGLAAAPGTATLATCTFVVR